MAEINIPQIRGREAGEVDRETPVLRLRLKVPARRNCGGFTAVRKYNLHRGAFRFTLVKRAAYD
jgi:hypothetical protein